MNYAKILGQVGINSNSDAGIFLRKKSLDIRLLSGHLFLYKDRVKHVLCGPIFFFLIVFSNESS